ncbi:MAG: 1,4-dihydroxy-6-naphthoate synthase [Desulforhopalus sp.]
MRKITLGYSPCPNDTFIFYGLVHGKSEMANCTFAEPVLKDVEQLNLMALNGQLDVTKMSFHALGHVLDEYCILSAGSALGRGCGPLLVAGGGKTPAEMGAMRIAIPGRLTTAAMLLKMFLPHNPNLVEMRFDLIMPAISRAEVDAGVIIHESRFTYQEHGLVCLQDLGEWWERSSSMPIPLGCIAARRSLGRETIKIIDRAIRSSVAYGFSHPDECMPYIRSKSQELEPAVVQSHIDLYVNDFSMDLGQEGILAIKTFLERGRLAGVLPESARGLTGDDG